MTDRDTGAPSPSNETATSREFFHDWNAFSPLAQETFLKAQQEANRFGHTAIGTEDILLGLASTASDLFTELGYDTGKFPLVVEFLWGHKLQKPLDTQLELTRASNTVAELALRESESRTGMLSESQIDQYDLVTALLLEKGLGALVLESFGASVDIVRQSGNTMRERNTSAN